MSAPFVVGLRARAATIRLQEPGVPGVTIRVEMPEVWDAVRIETPLTEPLLTIKRRALAALFPTAEYHEDFVVKLDGWEVLNEHETLADAGAVDGSILLLTHRRRRPLR
jgi:hypothetical protein